MVSHESISASVPLWSATWTLAAGFLFGLRHALDVDHLAAVSALISERGRGLQAWLIGAAWGIGHTLSLSAAAIAVIVLNVQISGRAASAFELAVAVMLVVLGIDALRTVVRHGEHDDHGAHRHPIAGEVIVHDHGLRRGLRPMLVGMVHGLAGSAALTLLVLSALPSPRLAIAYVVVFGVGSIVGMIAMSVLVSMPLQVGHGRFHKLDAAVRTAAAVFSIVLGVWMAYDLVPVITAAG